jgi:hypothetical protein
MARKGLPQWIGEGYCWGINADISYKSTPVVG